MTKDKLTPAEEQAEKRKIAITNLTNETLMSLAGAYLVEYNSIGDGESDKLAVHNFKYLPALSSKEGQKFRDDEMMKSRQKGRRYTGNVSEANLIQKAAEIREQSLKNVTVQDILNLHGSKDKAPGQYADKYLGELLGSEDESVKNYAKNIFAFYNRSFTNRQVIEARAEDDKNNGKNLEEIVKQGPQSE